MTGALSGRHSGIALYQQRGKNYPAEMKRPNMITDPVGPTLIRLMLPMVAGALGIVMFNVVDTFFVGRLGALELAAMSYTFPVVIVAGSIASGLGIGASANVSRALGAGDRASAERLTLHAHLLGFAIVVVIAAIGLATIEIFFTALGAQQEIMGLIHEYMVVWYIGMPFVVLPMIGQNILQATGDSKTPSMVIVFAVTLNVLLDPLLIFGLGPFPALGIQGAAIATVIARGSTALIVLMAIIRRDKLFPHHPQFHRFPESTGQIFFVGIPAILTNLALPISMAVVTRLVSMYGPDVVAGFGVATRLESFSLVFTFALSMVFTPFVGQNLGAGRIDRARSGHRVAAIMSLVWGAAVAVIFATAGQQIAAVFNDAPTVVATTALYLWTLAPSFGLMGIVTVSAAAFNGLQRPFSAAAVAFLRLVGLYIPLAIVGRAVAGLSGLFVGLTIGNIIAGVVAYIWFQSSSRQMIGASSDLTTS